MHYPPPTDSVYLDLSDRAKLRLTGTDRVRFLNGQVSNDVRQTSAERSVYTGVMTIKGKLCADAFVHGREESLFVDAEPELREALAARLERYMIADDVALEDVTDAFALLHLIDFAADAGTGHLPTVRPALATLGAELWTVESLRYGRPGVDVFYPPELDGAVRRVLHAGFTELNDDAAEAWRIVAGVPRWGAELDENTMPAEAGIEERAVSYAKGCYIGQEIVSRIKSVGHVNRQLRGLRATDSSPLFAGMTLHAPAVEDGQPGKEIGRITSAAASVGHGGAEFIALGYVRREFAAPGTLLDAVSPPEPGEESHAATPPCRVEVCALPFV